MGYVEDLRKLVGHQRIILAGATALILNEKDELLLQHRSMDGRWSFPGGLMELAESTKETAVREVYEESGLKLDIDDLHLLDVYSGKDRLCRAANGDEWYVVNAVYWTRTYEGTPRVCDSESLEMCWVSPYEMPDTLAEAHKIVLKDFLERGILKRQH